MGIKRFLIFLISWQLFWLSGVSAEPHQKRSSEELKLSKLLLVNALKVGNERVDKVGEDSRTGYSAVLNSRHIFYHKLFKVLKAGCLSDTCFNHHIRLSIQPRSPPLVV